MEHLELPSTGRPSQNLLSPDFGKSTKACDVSQSSFLTFDTYEDASMDHGSFSLDQLSSETSPAEASEQVLITVEQPPLQSSSTESSAKKIDKVRNFFTELRETIAAREQELLALNDQLAADCVLAANSQQETCSSLSTAFQNRLQAFPALKAEPTVMGKVTQMRDMGPRLAAVLEAPQHFPQATVQAEALQDLLDDWFGLLRPDQQFVAHCSKPRVLTKTAEGCLDTVSFTTKQSVEVTGIGLFPTESAGRLAQIVVSAGNDVVYRHTEFGNSVNWPQSVTFETPLHCKEHTEYTLQLIVEGTCTFSYDRTREGRSLPDCNWQFWSNIFDNAINDDQSDLVCGPLACVYYQKGSEDVDK